MVFGPKTIGKTIANNGFWTKNHWKTIATNGFGDQTFFRFFFLSPFPKWIELDWMDFRGR